jgi:uncharacterized protein YdcH (DUF465 family)
MPESMEEKFTRMDRDTIIRLDTKFDSLTDKFDKFNDDIKDLKDNVVNRVCSLEETRANKQDLDLIKQKAADLELRKVNHTDIVALDTRIESLEGYRNSWKTATAILILVAGVFISLVCYVYFNDINTIKTELQHHIESTQK